MARLESMTRHHAIGGLMKLNPHSPSNPVVWSVPLGTLDPDGGSLSTPALYKGVVYDAGTDAEVVAVGQQTGKAYWRITQGSPTWASPVTIDDQMILGDKPGRRAPLRHLERRMHRVDARGVAPDAVGRARGGQFYGIGDPGPIRSSNRSYGSRSGANR